MQNQTPLLPLPDDLPSFIDALGHLDRIPNLLYHGLEAAAAKTAEFKDAESPDERFDEGLAASLMRFHLLKFLKNVGVEAFEEEWDLENLAFLGIAFYFRGYHVKVLKGPNGCLPGCGVSEKRTRFYSQLPTFYLVDNRSVRTTANLILLWDFDRSYGLSGIWLALPAVGGKRMGDVSAFWIERLAHPTEGISEITEPGPTPTDDLSDLLVPIEEPRKVVGT